MDAISLPTLPSSEKRYFLGGDPSRGVDAQKVPFKKQPNVILYK